MYIDISDLSINIDTRVNAAYYKLHNNSLGLFKYCGNLTPKIDILIKDKKISNAKTITVLRNSYHNLFSKYSYSIPQLKMDADPVEKIKSYWQINKECLSEMIAAFVQYNNPDEFDEFLDYSLTFLHTCFEEIYNKIDQYLNSQQLEDIESLTVETPPPSQESPRKSVKP